MEFTAKLLLFLSSGLCICYGAYIHSPFVNITDYNASVEGKIWAVLVAGSNTWDNYRHQADVCHAYQVLHNHGVPDERIIVMMYDDIAFNENNPTPGVIINHPNGPNVYKGVPKDYTGKDVTPKNLLHILQGDDMHGIGTGKTLKSGPKDHVFLYFSDHGAPGLLAFPSSQLKARDLNRVIRQMNLEKRFAKMVIYIEACESGSMFTNLLPDNVNVYATTAANAAQSSLACYYDGDRGTFLGDVYSVKWMEDSDQEVLSNKTLHHQYILVKNETDQSTVMQFGDLKISQLHVSEFQGRSKSPHSKKLPKVPLNAVPSPDVPIAVLKHKIDSTKSSPETKNLKQQLLKVLRNRRFMNKTMEAILSYLTASNEETPDYWNTRQEIRNFDCYEEVVDHFDAECFKLSKNPYALRQLYLLVNLCENKVPLKAIKKAMNIVCTHPPIHGIM